MKAPQSYTTYLLGVCPACGDNLVAGIVIDPHLSAPKVAAWPNVTVEVDPKVVGMALNHMCGGADYPPVAKEVSA